MKGRIFYKKEVKINGYKGLFLKECKIAKDGYFRISHPVKIVRNDLVKTDYVCSDNLKEAEEMYSEAVSIFEMLNYSFELIILFQMEEKFSYKDGSGEGFVFNWGVYKKINTKDNNQRYHYLRGFNSQGVDNEYAVRSSDIKHWKQIKWSKEAEWFFNQLTLQVRELYEKLNFFLNTIDLDKIIKKDFLEKTNNQLLNNG